MEKFKYLLLIDTDKIKDYVFASSKLKEIRGASSLLEYLNTVKSKELINDNFSEDTCRILYLDGGSGKVEFMAEDDAKKCGKLISNLYKDWTKTASITWVVEEINQSKYMETVSKAEYMMRLKKQEGRNLGQSEHLGFLRRCDHNGKELVEDMSTYADINPKIPGIEDRLIKENASKGNNILNVSPSSIIKRAFAENPISSGGKSDPEMPVKDLIIEKYKGASWPEKLPIIGEASGNDEIALIYFDGNSMNKVLSKLGEVDEYIDFSKNLKETIKDALTNTVLNIYSEEELPLLKNKEGKENEYEDEVKLLEEKVLPLEFVMTAGDDIIVITPSTVAMDFAREFLHQFNHYANVKNKVSKTGDIVTMSAGIAIAKSSYPIKHLVPVAESLLRSAKRKNYQYISQGIKDWEQLSTLDYMVVSMSSNPDLEAIRSEQFYRENNRKKYHLTSRPFSYQEWTELDNVISKMQNAKDKFPNSKMKSFYHLHFMDDWEAEYYYRKFEAKLKPEQKENFKYLYNIFSPEENFSLWYVKDNEYYSPLLDLFEIYPYVDKSEERSDKKSELQINA